MSEKPSRRVEVLELLLVGQMRSLEFHEKFGPRIHSTLRWLESKKLARSWETEATPERGYRPGRTYAITPEGRYWLGRDKGL